MSPPTIVNFDSPAFRLSPPAKHFTIAGPDRVIIQALPITDFWRIPAREGEDAADRRNGAFFAIPVDSSKSFEAGVWIQGKWGVQFDQGCLMVVAGDNDGKDTAWVKTGVEVDGGKQWVGGVVASPWSDWSIQPALKNTSQLSDKPSWLFIRLVRLGPTLQIYHLFAPEPIHVDNSSPDLLMIREVKGFDQGNDDPAKQWRVGVMVCGPMNNDGTEATFANFSFKYL